MNNSRIRIGLGVGGCLVLLFLIVSYLKNIDLEKDILGELVFTYRGEEQIIDFPVWKDEAAGKYYLFLPSWFYGKAGEFTVHYNDYAAKVKVDGIFYPNGGSFTEDGGETEHSLEVSRITGGESVGTTLQILRSEKLPSIFIEIENEDKVLDVEGQMDDKHSEIGIIHLMDESGKILYQGEMEKFRVHGNHTATLDKKPFTFILKEPTEFLGMEAAAKWKLLANATDGAYIRNKIVRDLANQCINTYEPEGEFAEVYLNGVYQGLYLLTEAVEIDKNRLEIDPETNWFIEMELDYRAREDDTQMITNRGQIFIIHTDENVTETERVHLLERLNDIESALFAENGISDISGKSLEELIDMDSFAKAWLIEELSGDHDVGTTSQFAYISKEEDTLLYAGPTWDFDGIMANVSTPMYGIPEALTGVVENSTPEDDNNKNRWLAAMWRNPKFQELVKRQYKENFREEYEKILKQGIAEYTKIIRRSVGLDAFRWHEKRLSWFFTLPDGIGDQEECVTYEDYDTFDECMAVVQDFMSRKLNFLDKLWIEEKEFCIVEVRNEAPFLDIGYNQTLYYWVEQGAAIHHLPHYETEEWQFDGYYDKDYNDLIYDGFIIEYHRIVEGHWSQREEESYEGESDGN